MIRKMDDGYKEFLNSEVKNYNLTENASGRIYETYDKLGVQKEVKIKRGVKPLIISFSSAVLCFVMLFSFNLAFPALAEEIPLIGDLFKQLNSSSKSSFGENIGTYEPNNENLALAEEVKSDFKLKVKQSYSDGEFIHLSFELDTPRDFSVPAYEDNQKIYADAVVKANGGETTISGLMAYGNFFLVKETDGKFTGTISAMMAEKYTDGEEIQVDIDISNFIYDNYKEIIEAGDTASGLDEYKTVPIPQFTSSMKIKCDASHNKQFNMESEIGDIKLYSVEATPSKTVIDIELPYWGSAGTNGSAGKPVLFLEDGTVIKEVYEHGYEYDHEHDLNFREDRMQGKYYFDGVPNGTEKVILRFYWDQYYNKVVDEITIDLNSGNAVQSETYNEDGPLNAYQKGNYRSIFYEDISRMGGMGFEDNNVVDDYNLVYLNYDNGKEYEWYTGNAQFVIEIPRAYRDIKVSVYKDGQLFGEGLSDDAPAPSEDEYMEHPEIPVERNHVEYVDGVLRYSIYVPINGDELSTADTQLTMKVTDPATDELLYETVVDLTYMVVFG